MWIAAYRVVVWVALGGRNLSDINGIMMFSSKAVGYCSTASVHYRIYSLPLLHKGNPFACDPISWRSLMPLESASHYTCFNRNHIDTLTLIREMLPCFLLRI